MSLSWDERVQEAFAIHVCRWRYLFLAPIDDHQMTPNIISHPTPEFGEIWIESFGCLIHSSHCNWCQVQGPFLTVHNEMVCARHHKIHRERTALPNKPFAPLVGCSVVEGTHTNFAVPRELQKWSNGRTLSQQSLMYALATC